MPGIQTASGFRESLSSGYRRVERIDAKARSTLLDVATVWESCAAGLRGQSVFTATVRRQSVFTATVRGQSVFTETVRGHSVLTATLSTKGGQDAECCLLKMAYL